MKSTSNWNYNLEEAPRGKIIPTPIIRKTKKGPIEVLKDIFHKDVIITASSCGKVTNSYWIPDEKRWCMYTKEDPPIAWQPWPKHPNEE